MTKPPEPPRKNPGREPPTIDLKARETENRAPEAEAPAAEAAQEAAPPAAAEASATPDATAVAEEGPAPEVGASADDPGAPSMESAPDDAAPAALDSGPVDPTVPIPDEAFEPAAEGGATVPPIAGPEPREAASRSGARLGALIGAGLLGGLVGAGLLYGLQTWRAWQAPPDPRLAQIEQRLGALPSPDAVQGVERRIAALEAAQGDLGRRADEVRALAERGLARADEAAARPIPAPAPSQPATPAPAIPPDLAERIGALEAALRAAAPPPDLAGRLGALEAEARDRAQGNSAALQALEARIGEASQASERRIAGAEQAEERRLADIGQAIDRRLAELGQGLNQRLGQGEKRIAALDRKLSEWNTEALRAGFRVVLAGRLNDALAQGAPFADVLGGLKRFAIAPERLEALEPLAATGAPNAAALAREFEPFAERVFRETRGEAESIGERIRRMAEKVVSIRPVDEPGSTAVPALVARISNALARNALAEAAAAWDALPEPARRASEEWGRRLKGRLAAENAARGIASDAVAALNAAPQ